VIIMARADSTRSRLTETSIKALQPQTQRYDVPDEIMTGLALRVTPAGVKSWSLRYRTREGGQRRFTIGKWPAVKLARARELATIELGKVAGGDDIQQEKVQDRNKKACPTIKAFCGEGGAYRQWVEAHHKAHKQTLYRLTEVLPWQERRLDQIDAKRVERWQTKRINGGTSPWTVKRDIATLRAMMSKAVEWGHLEIHPLATLKAPKAADNSRIRYLSKDEEKRLLSALMADSTPAHLRAIVTIAMNTGLRRGELLQLDWSSVDLKANRLTVTAQTAKSSKVRHVPLNKKALAALKAWKKPAARTGPVFGMTDIKKSWATLMTLSEITGFRYHDLRHNFASKLVMAGIDLNTVRELLGHSDIRMTLRYAHLAPEHAAAAVEVL